MDKKDKKASEDAMKNSLQMASNPAAFLDAASLLGKKIAFNYFEQVINTKTLQHIGATVEMHRLRCPFYPFRVAWD